MIYNPIFESFGNYCLVTTLWTSYGFRWLKLAKPSNSSANARMVRSKW